MHRNAKFITIEGCEGVGKTTQIKLLKNYFLSNGIDVVFTREPGGTPIAEDIRKIILSASNTSLDNVTELLLYTAARSNHVNMHIIPLLQSGKTVICDRFIHSTLAYQGYARGLNLQQIDTLNKIALGNLKIDACIFLDLDPVSAFTRKGGADKTDRLESAGLDFHKRVYEGYKQLAKLDSSVICINASGTKEQTHQKVVSAVLKVLGI